MLECFCHRPGPKNCDLCSVFSNENRHKWTFSAAFCSHDFCSSGNISSKTRNQVEQKASDSKITAAERQPKVGSCYLCLSFNDSERHAGGGPLVLGR